MNKKILLKVITVALVIIAIVGFVSTNAFAESANSIISGMNNSSNVITDQSVLQMAGKIMGAIRNVSIIAGVIILMVLGIKYMMGSLEEKADYKKSMIPLVVGIVIVIAATSIISMIFNFF